MSEPRRFWIRTFGCQMNAHDTEKVSNLLLHAGWHAAGDPSGADLLIVNTCSIRAKAEHKLYTDLGRLREWKAAAPGRVLGVGGCVAQQEGASLLERFGQVDFVFGTHNLRRVPALAEAALAGRRAAHVEERRSLERFDLPGRHPAYASATPGRAFLTVMEGCDMFCSFCVVPRTRGREISRPAAAIVAEARSLAERGVRELTLLGQTVNAYGRHDVARGRSAARGVVPFAELLGELDAIPGLERIRYTSPHPLFFDAALIRAHGELEHLCPHVHLPLQSGSDRILERMRRRYTAERYRAIVAELRAARPDLAITSDVIVGFPGESEADFAATLELVEEVALADHYAFKYSPRPGTAAAALDERLPDEVIQERFDRLQALQDRLRFAANQARLGRTCEVLVEGPSRRGGGQLRGTDPWHRVVILEGAAGLAPGDLVDVTIVEATPHSLIGEPDPATVRPGRPWGRAAQDGVKTGPDPAEELRRGEPARARPVEATA